MGLRVNSNVASINAQRNLVNSTGNLQKSLQRLSSGLRITRAADDAAGLAISEGFRADIRSLSQAQRNANDGISLLQVGEGALNEVSSILIRQRELAIQAANGTLGDSERETLNTEFQDLLSEIDRIAAVTSFNGTNVLQGGGSTTFQIGIDATSNDRISIASVDARASQIGLVGDTISTVTQARAALSSLDSAISEVASLRASFGTVQNRGGGEPDPRRGLRERDGGADAKPGAAAGRHLGSRSGQRVDPERALAARLTRETRSAHRRPLPEA